MLSFVRLTMLAVYAAIALAACAAAPQFPTGH